MKIHAQLEWQDYLNAQMLHLRQPILVRVLGIIFLIFAGGSGIYVLLSPQLGELTYQYIIFLIGLGLYLVYRYILLPRRTKRVFEQQKTLHALAEFEITENALVSDNKFAHSEQPWSSFHKWKEDDNLLLLYHSAALFTILPKRFFNPDQIEAIKTHLQANQIPTKPKRLSGRSCLIFALLFVAILAFLVWNFQQSTMGY